jgi:hypothetical protein
MAPTERNDELWHRAEERWPRKRCGCGAVVWRHWSTAARRSAGIRAIRDLVDLCPGVHDCPAVEAEYERLVAEAVERAFCEPDVVLRSVDTQGFHVQQSKAFSFGFKGFKFNNAPIVRSRYTPGKIVFDWEGSSPHVYNPDEGGFVDPPFLPHTSMNDASWGFERAALRRYFAPRVIRPESKGSIARVVNERASFRSGHWRYGDADPLVTISYWGDLAKLLEDRSGPLVQPAYEIPERLVGFKSGVLLYA